MMDRFPNIDRNTLMQLLSHAETELINGHLALSHDVIFNVLEMIENKLGKTEKIEDFAEISENYKRMLYFVEEGMDDPMREMIFHQLVRKTHRVIQEIRRTYDIAQQNNVYADVARKILDQSVEQDNVTNGKTDDMGLSAADQMFNRIWTSSQLTSDEEKQYRQQFAIHNDIQNCYMLSALTLALMHYFDAGKLRLLLDMADHENEELRARAVLGIAIAVHLHHRVIPLYVGLSNQITDKFKSTETAIEVLAQIQYHIAMYRASEQIQRKMEQDILPTLVNVTRQRIKLGFEDMDIDLSDPDSMPNISKKERRKLAEGMQEMTRLYHEGMDINLQTFASLKHFPFFQYVCHWLAPYDPSRPEVPNLEAIAHLPLCDSDKYSVAMLLQHVSKEQKENLQQILENHDGMFMIQDNKSMDTCQNVVQSFYRCLKRSPWRTLWPDVFSTMLLTDNPVLGDILRNDVKYLRKMSTMLLRNKRYSEAEKHIHLLAQKEGSDSLLLMQMALCMQEQGKFARAIDCYKQAEMLGVKAEEPLLYRMQYCCAQLGHYDEQLECLLRLEKMHPDEAKVLTEVGMCLMQLERWDEAQKRFYKMEFRGQRVLPSMRAIAWCALRQKDYALAYQYYGRILTDYRAEAKWEDYLNAAHVAWLENEISRAITLYREYMHRYITATPNTKNALEPFEQDAHILIEHGKSATDIALMHDLIGKG